MVPNRCHSDYLEVIMEIRHYYGNHVFDGYYNVGDNQVKYRILRQTPVVSEIIAEHVYLSVEEDSLSEIFFRIDDMLRALEEA